MLRKGVENQGKSQNVFQTQETKHVKIQQESGHFGEEKKKNN